MFLSRVCAVVLAAGLCTLGLAGPEHVHADEASGSHHVVVHRHLATHLLSHSSHHPSLSEDDDPLVSVTPLYTMPAARQYVAAPVITLIPVSIPPAGAVLVRTARRDEPLIHAPPRDDTPPRAPPSPVWV